MKLTIEEKELEDKLQKCGLDSQTANLLARLKCVLNKYHEAYPNAEKSFEQKEEVFFRYCRESGRFSEDEIKLWFIQFLRKESPFYNYNPYNPYSHTIFDIILEKIKKIFN